MDGREGVREGEEKRAREPLGPEEEPFGKPQPHSRFMLTSALPDTIMCSQGNIDSLISIHFLLMNRFKKHFHLIEL